MNHIRLSVLCVLVASFSFFVHVSAEAEPAERKLWYQQPAENWQVDALPIGNGNLGAMVFGNVETAHFMLNEDSLWIGNESDTGSYQSLGLLDVVLHDEPNGATYSANANGAAGETVEQAFDNDAETKWCVENNGQAITANVVFSGELPLIQTYSITSANDVPSRDPKDWALQGSDDGKTWQTIDARRDEPQWTKRYQAREFRLANPSSFKHYRFNFQADRDPTHFQVADIQLGPSRSEQNADASFADYRRELDISTAVHRTNYARDGVHFRRESFASHPAGILVFRFTADASAAHSGEIRFSDSHGAPCQAEGDTIISAGDLAGFVYNKQGRQAKNSYGMFLNYETQIKVLHKGGTLVADAGAIRFANCDSMTILVAADTNYLNQRNKGWKGTHPHQNLSDRLSSAAKHSYDQLRDEHIADYQSLYNRFSVSLAKNKNSDLPTDDRLDAYQSDKSDLDFEALLTQYARYLMISCSRPGSLPANLQGLWNPSNNPPWRCDYHSDVNLQMNYWFVDQVNLSESFQPFADYQFSVRAVRRENTRKHYGDNIRGWATRSENGIFGGSSYLWVPGDAAWLAQNLWDHYAYTQDKTYLKERAYPIIKELCQFWEDYLIEMDDGTLVSPASVSPEHGPEAVGNSYEQQLVYDLFTNFIQASSDLEVDAEFRKTVSGLRDRLLKPQVGKWGQLQEWMKDIDDPKDQHRHLSHLIGVYPGRQIAPSITPELAQAAAVSLDARGDSGTGWSIGWKINLWARLLDGDRAHRILRNALKKTTTTTIVMNYGGGTYPNLLMAHPPFQIEANFGYTSGFCEMLMQSHLDELHLLPALPSAWPEGKVTGLKARGNYMIDIVWADAKLKSATIHSNLGTTPKIRVAGEDGYIDPANDSRITITGVSR